MLSFQACEVKLRRDFVRCPFLFLAFGSGQLIHVVLNKSADEMAEVDGEIYYESCPRDKLPSDVGELTEGGDACLRAFSLLELGERLPSEFSSWDVGWRFQVASYQAPRGQGKDSQPKHGQWRIILVARVNNAHRTSIASARQDWITRINEEDAASRCREASERSFLDPGDLV